MPDGNGGQKEYNCKKTWRLLISSSGLYKLSLLGFAPKRLKFIIRQPTRDAEQFGKIVSVKQSFTDVDTYCFTEPKQHRGVFNGVLTSQCAEITEYSDGQTTAVCNLASICLPRFVITDPETKKVTFDFNKLVAVTRVLTINLNKVIDINYYPAESTVESNRKNRPIGIGVQGLADVYNLFGYAFDSLSAQQLNKKIFETIYYSAINTSKDIAKVDGPYDAFRGSPFSEGKLQYHLWGMTEDDLVTKNDYDWLGLVEEVKKYGTRNSLLTALMPTAGTSQIMKCSESFEPYMSNVFVRTTMAGEFVIINENLIRDLLKLGLWSDDMRKLIIIKNGSIQDIPNVPTKIKSIYKTAFELKLKQIISQSADRGPFIDQSQSMNLFMKVPNYEILTSAHFYSWERGCKTGMYYLRTTPAVSPIQFGIDVADIIRLTGKSGVTDLIMDHCDINLDEIEVKMKKSNDGDVGGVMCKYIPGKSAEGCESCSG